MQENGFEAVAKYTEQFDGASITLANVLATQSEINNATNTLLPEEKRAMKEMKKRIQRFVKIQKNSMKDVVWRNKEGTTSLVFRPVERVGIYVPAGRAPLFSSLFMAALPAKEAGVQEIIVCSPPNKNGNVSEYILAAAKMCGVEKIYKIGGAQAIGAMAYGIEEMEQVNVICGPGNAYVNAAKQEVATNAQVRIDVPAGPSEVLIIADKTANAAYAAADMLAQSEHGYDSAAICICTDVKIALQIAQELQKQLEKLPQDNAAFQSIPKWGKIFVAKNMKSAIAAANEIAPEHLELMIRLENAKSLLPKIKNTGAVFVQTAEAFCDYGMSGGNHILPTGSAAKAWGGVSVQTFGKWMYVDGITVKAQETLAKKTALLARMEGLEAHAKAAEIRNKIGKKENGKLKERK